MTPPHHQRSSAPTPSVITKLGKAVGLDRVPEVRTLREKIARIAATCNPGQWMRDLAKTWIEDDPDEAAYLYLDGHVRVYHGSDAKLPRRYVSRQKLCLRGTTDCWINDALGRPFFVISKAVTEGLATTLLDEILRELLDNVPGQPTAGQLQASPAIAGRMFSRWCQENYFSDMNLESAVEVRMERSGGGFRGSTPFRW